MTKHDDDVANRAVKRIETEPIPGIRVGINIPDPLPERLRKVPGVVTSEDLAVIRRAIMLKLASIADMDDDSAESTGRALALICRAYLLAEREQRSGKGGSGG